MRKTKSGKANQNLLAWAAPIPVPNFYLSAITILELEMGILLVERRNPSQGLVLRSWLSDHVLSTFKNRVIPVDIDDALIAETAIVHGMQVVTRNVQDFLPMDVELINPWVEDIK